MFTVVFPLKRAKNNQQMCGNGYSMAIMLDHMVGWPVTEFGNFNNTERKMDFECNFC